MLRRLTPDHRNCLLNKSQDCFVLQQGCQTLSKIAEATVQELMDCSLDQETAKKVNNFFQKKFTV